MWTLTRRCASKVNVWKSLTFCKISTSAFLPRAWFVIIMFIAGNLLKRYLIPLKHPLNLNPNMQNALPKKCLSGFRPGYNNHPTPTKSVCWCLGMLRLLFFWSLKKWTRQKKWRRMPKVGALIFLFIDSPTNCTGRIRTCNETLLAHRKTGSRLL